MNKVGARQNLHQHCYSDPVGSGSLMSHVAVPPAILDPENPSYGHRAAYHARSLLIHQTHFRSSQSSTRLASIEPKPPLL